MIADGDDRAAAGNRTLSGPAIPTFAPRHAERIADVGVLAGGLVLGIAASAALIALALGRGGPRLIVGVGAYVTGLLAMLGCSLLYRSAIEARRRQFYRRLDHAAIFALIAGTATPFALTHGGILGVALAMALWAVATIGIAVKLCFPIGGMGRSVMVYLLLGWASLARSVPRYRIGR